MIALPCVGLIIFIQIKKITVQTVFAPFDMTDFYLAVQESRSGEVKMGAKRKISIFPGAGPLPACHFIFVPSSNEQLMRDDQAAFEYVSAA